ncbi:type I restriction endonuclease [Alloalcanivorax mobilis]|uniref:type I restriction endonuclease n=1 Tax=Alloalcanivorax mobilis TaxID=2019569 RepID=UPI000C75F9E6|nr:type I restriction endonuclease [Alloalcanivorax mobilis]|tara:strand:+ start:2658 stop:3782 length:1125 start_codon:yes stop_codon:yes gene_type:complete
MEFEEKISWISSKIESQSAIIETEEATKTALVMPFIKDILGYDIFNPAEVVPEFTADVGTKRGEKVDYAILKDGEVQILIEAKKYNDPLSINHASQLYRYFSVTSARIAILTNGKDYKFYTDLDAPNKMDDRPFLEFDLTSIDDHSVPELRKLTKSSFDLHSIINAASELRDVRLIKREIDSQFSNPDEEFVRFFASRIHSGTITQRVRDHFQSLTRKALRQYLNDKINERLKSAISSNVYIEQVDESMALETSSPEEIQDNIDREDGVITTMEEIEGFNIVKAIIRSEVDVKRIAARDTKSYFGVLLDDNNRKPICRLHFNRTQKYIGLFDAEKKETRHPIECLDDIFGLSDHLKDAVKKYVTPTTERQEATL